MKNILITGNLGFIGSWLSIYIKKLFPDVKIYGYDDRRSYGKRLIDLLPKEFVLFEYSCGKKLEDINALQNFIQEHDIDTIIHLAAQAIVPRAFEQPILTFNSNVISTLNILEASRVCRSIERISIITSDKVYKNSNISELFHEESLMIGKDIYSCSKVICEHLAHAYRSTHLKQLRSQIHTIRLGNVVGGGDYSVNRLIPDLISAYLEKEIFFTRYPHATRPFQHILDVCRGIVDITTDADHDYKDKSLEGWNLGPRNNSYAFVSDVIKMFCKYFPNLEIKQSESLYEEDIRLEIDNGKYSSRYGAPIYDSVGSIAYTLDWYKAVHCTNKDPLKITISQIEDYLSKSQ